MIAVTIIFALFCIGYMAWLSRMCGGGNPELPFGLDAWFYALPYLLFLIPICGWYALIGYAGAVLGKRLGHGRGISLGIPTMIGSPEKIEVLISWAQKYTTIYEYKALILGATGIAATIASTVLLAIWGHPWAAAIIFWSGALKALAYVIGWDIFPDNKDPTNDFPAELNSATEIGEFLTGFFAGLGIALALIFV